MTVQRPPTLILVGRKFNYVTSIKTCEAVPFRVGSYIKSEREHLLFFTDENFDKIIETDRKV
jgi:hypothetical protein